ncbi:hypothetical protein BVG81_004090 [Haliangium sp. UPWRP_2]|nr:hypothetical protein BVG81_004090 [Haliangium sp. UPWRP_2]
MTGKIYSIETKKQIVIKIPIHRRGRIGTMSSILAEAIAKTMIPKKMDKGEILKKAKEKIAKIKKITKESLEQQRAKVQEKEQE